MPLGTVPENVSEDAIAFAKRSFRTPSVDKVREVDPEFKKNYEEVLAGIVRNVKTKPGGFLATSGVVLPYYLNLSTNFMDTAIAPKLVEVVLRMLMQLHEDIGSPTEKVAVVGMEVAGGMLVSQLASSNNSAVNKKFDFIYMRKHKKTTGTAQQLEAQQQYTDRTTESAPLKAVWVDDVNSTGSSLCEGINTLEKDFHMDVVAALYVVDRSADRQNLELPRQRLSDERFTSGRTKIEAIMDLNEIDPLVKRE